MRGILVRALFKESTEIFDASDNVRMSVLVSRPKYNLPDRQTLFVTLIRLFPMSIIRGRKSCVRV